MTIMDFPHKQLVRDTLLNDSSTPVMPHRGDFGWQPLAGAFEPTLKDMMSDRSYFGMPPEALYLWGTLRDGDGEIYCPMRRASADQPSAGLRISHWLQFQEVLR